MRFRAFALPFRVRILAALFASAIGCYAVVAAQGGSSEDVVFRTRTDVVAVDVSVMSRGNPVRGLSAADFVVRDAGTVQDLRSISTEDLPIDVTFFIDTSSSVAELQAGLQRDTRVILRMLRPIDRLRVFTLGYDVHEWLPWQSPGASSEFAIPPVGRASNVYDGIWLAMIRRAAPGRRHLVIALTDGDDWGSAVTSADLVAAAGRTESVLHIVKLNPAGNDLRRPWQWSPGRPDLNAPANLREAAERSGGRVHEATMAGRQVVDAFDRAFDEFKQGYVLSYSYQGPTVEGWHPIDVAVARSDSYTVRARHGYFAQH